jgi:hypothetical protein
MTDQHSSSERSEFIAAPDFRRDKAADERQSPSILAPAREYSPLFPEYWAKVDFRKKPGLCARALPWLLAALVLPALTLLSWYLGGNEVWGLAAAVSGFLLIVVAHRTIGEVSRRGHLALGYLAVCWASWALVGFCWPISEVRIKRDWGAGLEQEPACPFRVRYGGQIEVERDSCEECSFRIRGYFRQDLLQIESLAPEGWRPRSLKIYDRDVYLEKNTFTRLYVDNRGNGEVTLACGTWRYRVGAGRQECLKILAPLRGQRHSWTLNDVAIGASTGEHILVDSLGARSYRFQTVLYERERRVWALEPLLPDLLGKPLLPPSPFGKPPLPPGNAPPPLGPTFHQGHIHELPGTVDYFLEPAPGAITVRTVRGVPIESVTRTELLPLTP